MSDRTIYLLVLFGIAGLAVVNLYRQDLLIFGFVLVVTLLAVTCIWWEIRRARRDHPRCDHGLHPYLCDTCRRGRRLTPGA